MNDRNEYLWKPFLWVLAFLVWFGFALVAVAGGILRVVWLEPRLGEPAANMIETLGLVGILAGLIWLATPWLVPSLGKKNLRTLGAYWLGLTIAFEFLFGHYVAGASWRVLLSNYDFTAGRLWILVPVTMALGPVLVGKLRNQRERPLGKTRNSHGPDGHSHSVTADIRSGQVR